MRCVLCAAAFLAAFSAASAAWAERIYVEAASADFSTRDEMFRVVAIMSGHPSLGADAIGVSFATPTDDVYVLQNLIRTGDPPRFERGDTLYLARNNDWYRGQFLATVPYTIEDRDGKCYFSVEFDGNLLGVPERIAQGRDAYMAFGFTLAHDGFSSNAGGSTTIDDPTFVPEPSSVALASLGVVALLVHLARRPRLRVRNAERHRRRKPSGECISAVQA